jgi:probable rRNA maturation factor
MRQKKREVRITNVTAAAVPRAIVRDAVVTVLDGEQTGPADISVTFLSSQRMRALNRRTFGVDRATDVIAFALPHPGQVVGDVYVCPSVARRAALRLGVTPREELMRLVVHGTLHVLGYDHPAGQERNVSLMWRVQERYVGGIERGRR